MTPFSQLPKSTHVNRVIPKNAFDPYCTSKQKKLFTEKVEKIRWTNKLSKDTINLNSNEVSEIQCFEITLKESDGIEEVIKILDKSIPYPILFTLIKDSKKKWVISKKHAHPTNEDNAVVDWTFETDWNYFSNDISFDLKISLDHVYHQLCLSIAGKEEYSDLDVDQLVHIQQETRNIQTKIERIKSKLKSEKQFNKKVELNLELQKLERKLAHYSREQ